MSAPWSPFGSALAAFHDRGEDVVVTVRNDYGETEELRASFFFRTEEAFEEWELIALEGCGPRVLDVGAGAGAHALVLQARGHEVTALDPSPEAVKIMRERGVRDVRQGTLFEMPPERAYDTVILLMNGSMIAETLSGLDRLLRAAEEVLAEDGTLILDSTDLREGAGADAAADRDDADDRAAADQRDVAPDRDASDEDDPVGERDDMDLDDPYVGELHYQLSAGNLVGDVFPQLFVDPDTLSARARLAGWDTTVVWKGSGGRYLAAMSVLDDAPGQDRTVSEALA